MTNSEINDRVTTVANMAALASKLDAGSPERALIMQMAAHLADDLTKPRFLVDMSNGKVIPFTGGKA